MSELNLMLVGSPGSGKGTQAKRLQDVVGLPHLSTGDMLRTACREGTALGQKAQGFMDAGLLVPDGLIVDLMRERLSVPDVSRGFVLDGFPRTGPQARALDEMLKGAGKALSKVVVIEVPDEVIVERISGRLSCRDCGFVHHRTFAPPRSEGICDACGARALYQREDDTEHKVRVRLDAYSSVKEQVIPHYEAAGLVVRIDGTRPPDEVFEGLLAAVGVERGSAHKV